MKLSTVNTEMHVSLHPAPKPIRFPAFSISICSFSFLGKSQDLKLYFPSISRDDTEGLGLGRLGLSAVESQNLLPGTLQRSLAGLVLVGPTSLKLNESCIEFFLLLFVMRRPVLQVLVPTILSPDSSTI